MKRMLLAGLCCTILLSSCRKSISGEGIIISVTRQIPVFNAVQMDGDATIEIVPGTVQKVIVEGYSNLVPIYETTVRNGVLHLNFENGIYDVKKNNLIIRIQSPDAPAVSTNGSGEVFISRFINGARLDLSTNGSGNLTVNNSSFDKAVFSVNGSGKIKAAGAQINEVDAEIHGSGDIELTCLYKMKARISGTGNIDYYGNPTTTDINVSGNGKVRKK